MSADSGLGLTARRWRGVAEHLGVFLTYLIAACVVRPSTVTQMGSAVVDFGDALAQSRWIYWGVQWLLGETGSLFDLPLAYPIPDAYVQADHLFSEALLTLPVAAFTREPLIYYHVATLLTTALSGYATYLLVRDLTGSRTAAFWAGVAYLLLPYRWVKLSGHLNLVATAFFPLVLWAIVRWSRSGRTLDAILVGVVYGLHGLSGVPMFVWTNPIVGGALLLAVLAAPRGHRVRRLLQACLAVGIALLCFGPIYWRYAEVYWRLGQDYPAEVGTTLRKWFNPPPDNWLWSRILKIQKPYNHEADIFWGVTIPFFFFVALSGRSSRLFWGPAKWVIAVGTFLALAVAMVAAHHHPWAALGVVAGLLGLGLAFRRKVRAGAAWVFDSRSAVLWAFALLAVVYGWLCFGTEVRSDSGVLTWGIHDLFRKIVPGATSARGPGRMQIVAALGAIVVAGFGVARVLDLVRNRWARAALAVPLVGLLVLEFAPAEDPQKARWNPKRVVPAEYVWLKAQPGSEPGIELPISMSADFAYMYWQAFHGKPIVNLWAGYIPEWRLYLEEHRQSPEFPRLVLDVLRSVGVRWISVRTSFHALGALHSLPWVRPWRQVDEVAFFRLDPPAGQGEAHFSLRLRRDGVEIVMTNPSAFPATAVPERELDLRWSARCKDQERHQRRPVVLRPFWVAAGHERAHRVPLDTKGLSGSCRLEATVEEAGKPLATKAIELQF